MPTEPRQLRIEYATEEAFREEYASNIANGGIFVSTKTPFCVRDPVRVEITLGFCGESIALDGEVVHCVPLELAETGATPGVAPPPMVVQPETEIPSMAAWMMAVLAGLATVSCRSTVVPEPYDTIPIRLS